MLGSVRWMDFSGEGPWGWVNWVHRRMGWLCAGVLPSGLPGGPCVMTPVRNLDAPGTRHPAVWACTLGAMSSDEQVGALMRDIRDARHEKECLHKKLRSFQGVLQRALHAVSNPMSVETAIYGGLGGQRLVHDPDQPRRLLPTAGEIGETIHELQQVTERLEAMQSRLREMGY